MSEPPDRDELELLTFDEVAALAKQNRRTIERRAADGTIPVVHPTGTRSVRITRAAALKYVNGLDPHDETGAVDAELGIGLGLGSVAAVALGWLTPELSKRAAILALPLLMLAAVVLGNGDFWPADEWATWVGAVVTADDALV